jgi:DNA-binding CsgD family transcriptional regulator
VLRETAERVTDPVARAILEGGRAAMLVSAGYSTTLGTEDLTGAAPTAVLAATLEHTAAGHLDRADRVAIERLASATQWVGEFPTIDLFLDLAQTRAVLLSGRVGEAEHHAEAAYDAAVIEGAEFPRAIWSLARGIVFLVRGLPRPAIPALREAAGEFEKADRGFRRPALAYLAMAEALAGDIAAATRDVRAAHGANPSLDGVFGVDVARADAWLHAARGELTAAARSADHAAELAASRHHPAFEALALHDVARFAPARAVADRLVALAGLVDGAFVDAMAVHARGLAGDDAALLDEAAREFSEMTLDLFAAEASLAAARVHRSSGRRASAFAALERARVLAARGDVAHTPTSSWADQPEDLTPREREIADLAAGDLPSREIAERLGITTRTVDNLLGRVYAKVGVSGRQELADLLGKHTAPR